MPTTLENLLNKTTFELSDTDVALRLIKKGCDVNTKNREGNSLLHRLATCDFNGIDHIIPRKAITTLIKTYKADIDCTNNIGKTPLQALMDQGRWNILDALLLIHLGANPNTKDSKDQPLIHRFVTNYAFSFSLEKDSHQAISTYVKTHHIDINCTDKDGKTPLQALIDVKLWRMDAVLILIDLGANPNSNDSQGQPLIHRLVCNFFLSKDHCQTISALVKTHHIDINCTNNNGKTPIQALIDLDIIYYNDRVLLLFLLLIKLGANPNTKDSQGQPLIHKVVTNMTNYCSDYQYHRQVISTLVETHHVDINCKNNDGKTPLQALIDKKLWNMRAVFFLIDLGADPNTKDSQGQPLIHRLVTYDKEGIREHEAITTLVKTHQVDINSKNNDGKTLLNCLIDQTDNFNAADALFLISLIQYSAESDQARSFYQLTLDCLSALNRKYQPHFYTKSSVDKSNQLRMKSMISKLNDVITGKVNYIGVHDKASVTSFLQSSALTPAPSRQLPSDKDILKLALEKFETDRCALEEEGNSIFPL